MDTLTRWLNSAGKNELAGFIRRLCLEATVDNLSKIALYADRLRGKYYGRRIFFRGLIEFSSYCKNNCYYCGIRRGNKKAKKYRLSGEQILDCCRKGYELGFRTFVLQSGEDPHYPDEQLCRIVTNIKEFFPDCAVTLSIGERSYGSYKQLFGAGADRYLLRHETADEKHYKKLHPPEQTLENRKRCLYNLKEIGYQVGAGFMVGSPFQTFLTLAEDLIFLRELEPEMIGIGPFIPHKETRFAALETPSPVRTLVMLMLLRIMLPKTLLPATTALGTVDKGGREKGIMAGANVVMPNLSPPQYRKAYALYDHKLCTGWEAAEQLPDLARHLKKIGFIPDFNRGDHVNFKDSVN